MRSAWVILLAILDPASIPQVWADDVSLDEREIPFVLGVNDPHVVRAASEAGLDPLLVYAIALVESGVRWSDGTRRPSPYVLRIDGRGVHAGSLEEIQEVWTAAEQQGARIEDIGPMQVNLRWNGHRVGNPRDLLDPSVNLVVGAQVLREELDKAPDVVTGIGRYHHKRHESRIQWYAGKVLRTYRGLMSAGSSEER